MIDQLKVLPIRILMNLLWLLDLSVYRARETVLLLVTSIFVCVFYFAYRPITTSTRIYANYMVRGVLSYQYSNVLSLQNSNVLGTKTKRDLPAKLAKVDPPFISAKSAYAVDVNSGKVLYSTNISTEFAPASTTKLMTALVALSIYSTDEVISVPEVCTKVDSSKIGLPATEKFKVIDLINAMLIQSAGDAACTLASVKVPYNDFIILMNTKAKNYGMQHTQFTNPIGLDGANYSTARDLYILAKNAVSNPVISKAVRSPSYSFKSRDEKYNITAYTTNKLLTDVPYSIGIKTGTTAEAGEVFIYEYKNGKKDLIIIVMGSTDRFTDTKNLLTWLLSSYTWE